MSEFGFTPEGSERTVEKKRFGVRFGGRSASYAFAGLFAVVVLIVSFIIGSFLGDLARDYAQRKSVPEMTTGLPDLSKASVEPGSPVAQEAVVAQSVEQQAAPVEADASDSQINILLLGSDERIDGEEPPRTDTLLLLTLDLRRQTAGMISLPRDLWVPIPGYNLTSKINTAYAIGEQRGYPFGGAQLAKDTVSSFIGQPVQFYVQADFNGFVRFIDEIGGITVNVPQTIYDTEYPTADYGFQTFYLEAGTRILDGQTALKYARTRNMDSDYGRAARQQQLIRAIADKVLAADMIPTLIARAPQLLSSTWGSVRTDMPLQTAAEVANYVRSNPLEVSTLVLDDRYGEESYSENGAWILLPNRDLIRPELKRIFDPEVGPNTVAGAPAEPLPQIQPRTSTSAEVGTRELLAADVNRDVRVMAAREVRLEILNGTGQTGIAALARRQLEASGWRVVSIGDADRSDYQHTLLVNYNTDDRLVRELGRQLDLTTTAYSLPGLLIPESTNLRIVIGEDFLSTVGGYAQ